MDAFPVSVKGVVVRDGRVLLLHNDRDEWELPGGRLEIGETPPECVAREITEESGWRVGTGPILDCWLLHIERSGRHLVIVTYGCHLLPGQESLPPVVSHEHGRAGLFSLTELRDLPMPQGYRDSIATWFARLGDAGR